MSIFDNEDVKYPEKEDDLVLLKNCYHQRNECGAFFSFLGIIAFCILFAIPYTIIPRHNSIVDQSYWIEVLLPVYLSFLLSAGSILLDMILFFEEKALKSVKVYLKMFFVIVVPCTILYIASYILWSLVLGFNHPLPYLAIICLLPTWGILPFAHWFILPKNLLEKEDFRKKLKTYMFFFLWFVLMVFQNEVLSFLFANAPTGSQFLVVFLLAACQKFDMNLRSRLLMKMMGKQDKDAMAILAIDVNVMYSSFIAVRVTGAEWATVFASVVVAFVLHLQMT